MNKLKSAYTAGRSGLIAATAALVLAAAPAANGDQVDVQNQALDVLNQRNIYFSPEEFVDVVNRGDADNVSVFIRAGMNPNTTIEGSALPIHTVSLKGYTDTLRALLEGGAFPNIRNERGWTPLMLSTLMEHEDCVELLLENGAEPDLRNDNGMTSLMIAVQERNEKIVRALLKAGADPRSKNDASVSAISIAFETRQPDMISIFEKGGYSKAVSETRKEMQAKRKPKTSRKKASGGPSK